MMTWVIGSFKKGMLRKKKATINMHVGGICCLTKKKGGICLSICIPSFL